jgi:hypothetical protein
MKPAAVFPMRSIAIRTIAALIGAGSTGAGLRPASAAELKPETVQAWDDYVQVMNAQMKARLQGGRFLWMDEQPRRSRDVRSGTILVTPMGAHNPAGVPNGLIHHWIGLRFCPLPRCRMCFRLYATTAGIRSSTIRWWSTPGRSALPADTIASP